MRAQRRNGRSERPAPVEELYRLVAENSTDMISTHTPEGVFTYASPACRSLLGYEPEDLLGRSAYELYHPEDLQAVREAHAAMLEGPDVRTVSYRIRRRDGSYAWFETTGRTVGTSHPDEAREIVSVSRDVTERKRSEEQIRFQAHLLDQVQAAVIATDLRGTVTFWNAHAQDLYGFSREEVLGRNISELTVGPAEADVAAEIMERLRGGEKWEGEFTVRRKDGRAFPAHVIDSPVRDSWGRAVGVVGVSTDVAERKRFEEQLRRSNRRIESILESITDAFFALDRGWRFTYVNRQAERILRRARGELLGKNLWEEFPEAVNSEFYEEYHEAVRSGEAAHFEAYYAPLESWVEVHAYPSEEGLTVYFHDVTERRQAEQELRFGKALLEAQTETAIDGILVVSSDRRMISYNRRFARMWEIPEEVLQARSDEAAVDAVKDKLVDPEGFVERLGHLYEHPDEESHEEIRLKDGRSFERYSAPVTGPDGTHYGRVWFFRDVTGRKRAERSLLEMRAAERRRVARDLHDAVLQDLAGTLQRLQALQLESRGDEQKAADLEQETEALRRAVGALRGAVHDLRREDVQPFVRAVESLVEYSRQLAPERRVGLSVHRDFPQELPRAVKAELLRIVQEALSNARQHADAEWIVVRLSRHRSGARVEVADDGRGFEPESVRRGLGLLGMRERAEALGAELEIRSEAGKGTTVSVAIPARALAGQGAD